MRMAIISKLLNLFASRVCSVADATFNKLLCGVIYTKILLKIHEISGELSQWQEIGSTNTSTIKIYYHTGVKDK